MVFLDRKTGGTDCSQSVSRSDKRSSSVAENFNTKPLAASPPRLQAIGATQRQEVTSIR
ncbi:MAG: hypothetical protein ACI92S_004639 [Planctomycetaceae bacterium]|jgi:hypothetical protein